MIKKIQDTEKGIALLLTVLILSGVLAISVGIATLATLELKPTREIGNSAEALSAAKSALECQLKEERDGVSAFDCPLVTDGSFQPCLTLSSGTECKILITTDVSGTVIKASGRFKGVIRSLEVTF